MQYLSLKCKVCYVLIGTKTSIRHSREKYRETVMTETQINMIQREVKGRGKERVKGRGKERERE